MWPSIGEATSLGGGAGITFKKGTTTTTDSSTTPTTTSSSGGTLPSTSGSGKLPQTGELVGVGVTLSGILLLMIALLTLREKRKSEK
ncbi:LPXTG cell wall anchor domain-containing protein [Enterococcus sp. HY326]|uniref:LPXTG cell wall anchor domain-containing protein n=1 Tax=Enterococcus sp. HY326 TaxID=2971265 RepID=UPI00224052F2|nr:LPXTG cell wall anchor domain-containing protein [Enterococcus sp. HY326]